MAKRAFGSSPKARLFLNEKHWGPPLAVGRGDEALRDELLQLLLQLSPLQWRQPVWPFKLGLRVARFDG